MPPERGPIPRPLAVLGGVLAVAAAMTWSRTHPTRAMIVVVEGPTYLCGDVPAGLAGRHSWVLRNVGTDALRLRTRFTSGRSGFSLWQGEDHLIGPGEQIPASLTWFAPTRPSTSFSAHAILRTNDPEKPELRLRVVGVSRLMDE